MNKLDLNENDIDLLLEALEKLPMANGTKDILGGLFESLLTKDIPEHEMRIREEKKERERYAREIETKLLKDRISVVATKLNVLKMNMENDGTVDSAPNHID
jgi:hypothetical protein